jgi:hypothetical protein
MNTLTKADVDRINSESTNGIKIVGFTTCDNCGSEGHLTNGLILLNKLEQSQNDSSWLLYPDKSPFNSVHYAYPTKYGNICQACFHAYFFPDRYVHDCDISSHIIRFADDILSGEPVRKDSSDVKYFKQTWPAWEARKHKFNLSPEKIADIEKVAANLSSFLLDDATYIKRKFANRPGMEIKDSYTCKHCKRTGLIPNHGESMGGECVNAVWHTCVGDYCWDCRFGLPEWVRPIDYFIQFIYAGKNHYHQYFKKVEDTEKCYNLLHKYRKSLRYTDDEFNKIISDFEKVCTELGWKMPSIDTKRARSVYVVFIRDGHMYDVLMATTKLAKAKERFINELSDFFGSEYDDGVHLEVHSINFNKLNNEQQALLKDNFLGDFSYSKLDSKEQELFEELLDDAHIKEYADVSGPDFYEWLVESDIDVYNLTYDSTEWNNLIQEYSKAFF